MIAEEKVYHAHICVDLQEDFVRENAKDGTGLPVPLAEGDPHLVPYNDELAAKSDVAIKTYDMHRPDSRTFASQHKDKKAYISQAALGTGVSTTWPAHCKINTKGGEGLGSSEHVDAIIGKGMDRDREEYAASAKPIVDKILENAPKGYRVLVTLGGLAENICVAETAKGVKAEMEKRGIDFEVIMVEDAARGVYKDQTGLEVHQTRQDFTENFTKETGIEFKKANELPYVISSRKEKPPRGKPVEILGEPTEYQKAFEGIELKDLPNAALKSACPECTRGAEMAVINKASKIMQEAQLQQGTLATRKTALTQQHRKDQGITTPGN